MDTELEHLRMRMIAMENLPIATLARAPERQLELGREMAAFISPRAGFTHHPRTVGAAAQMAHLFHRAEAIVNETCNWQVFNAQGLPDLHAAGAIDVEAAPTETQWALVRALVFGNSSSCPWQ